MSQEKELFKKLKWGRLRLHIHPSVFGLSALLIIVAVFATLLNLGAAQAVFGSIKSWTTSNFGWMLILCVQGFLLFCVYLAMSRFGNIRLGGSDPQREPVRRRRVG